MFLKKNLLSSAIRCSTCARFMAPIAKPLTSASLSDAHAGVALIRRRSEQRNVSAVGAAAISECIEIDGAVRDGTHRSKIDPGRMLFRHRFLHSRDREDKYP